MSRDGGVFPDNLRYTKEHEWLAAKENIGTVGVTHYAQAELGDIVYVDLPEVGAAVVAGESFGTVESVKAVSEIFSPVSGEVIEINAALKDHPESVNQDPYGDGWLVKIRIADGAGSENLMSANEYRKLIEDEDN